jgi:hypothetical protein
MSFDIILITNHPNLDKNWQNINQLDHLSRFEAP